MPNIVKNAREASMANPGSRFCCTLKSARIRNNLSQGELAERVGIKRQAVYDMESGRYLPNTIVALRLARELDCRVEDLFLLEMPEKKYSVTLAENPPGADGRVSLARVREHLIAYPMDGKWLHGDGFQAADGMLDKDGNRVELLQKAASLENNIFLLGCDPAFALLASHVSRHSSDTRIHCRFSSSLAAVTALAEGRAHAAGTHLHNQGPAEANLTLVEKVLPGEKVMVFAFSIFEEGLMVTRGNPCSIHKPADLAKGGLRLVNRETGAALRVLLDDCLARAGIPTEAVTGYENLVSNHSQGARMVAYGLADAALGLRAVAAAHELDFIPIQSVRCDLVIPCDLLELTAIKILLDVLQTHAMRKELASLAGYDVSCTGNLVGRLVGNAVAT
ncbi:MAG: substrate-binding domain-containing protein [Thermodesulfobacteriota bacterium]